jgi:hypothetical protein
MPRHWKIDNLSIFKSSLLQLRGILRPPITMTYRMVNIPIMTKIEDSMTKLSLFFVGGKSKKNRGTIEPRITSTPMKR